MVVHVGVCACFAGLFWGSHDTCLVLGPCTPMHSGWEQPTTFGFGVPSRLPVFALAYGRLANTIRTIQTYTNIDIVSRRSYAKRPSLVSLS